jgi:periplasmic copper chaperone A
MRMPEIGRTCSETAPQRCSKARMRFSLFLVLMALYLPVESVLSDSVPVKIERAWIQAVPPVSDATVAYMKITNLSASPLKLTGASSPAATMVEPMITTRKKHAGQEVMGMQSVAELIIPAANSLELKPGGDHLMVMGLRVHPKEGESVKLTLRFAPGDQKLDLEVPVFKEEPK